MRIVITTTLNNNLFRAKLTPLLRAKPGLEVVVITDREGPALAGVTWVWPHGWLRYVGRLGGRLLLLICAIFHPRTRLVMAYGVMPHGLFAVGLARLRRVPVFLHFIAGPAEIRFAHDVEVSDNSVIGRSRRPELWEAIVQHCARRADRIFVPGTVTRDFLVAEHYPPKKISILHSTVDPAVYFAADESRDIDVIISARLRARKRPIFTLRVLARLRERLPGVRFCWMGDGILHEEFKTALHSLQLSDVTEWISTDVVAPYYRRAKVFLLCSINEGLSLACLEAMASGAVPVVTDCGDMRDIVDPETTGCVLDVQASEHAFADAIAALLTDPTRLTAFAHAAARLVTTHHSFKVAERKWVEVLDVL